MILKIASVSLEDFADLAVFLAGDTNVIAVGRVVELKESKSGTPVYCLNLVLEINDLATRSQIEPFFAALGIFREI